MSDPPASFEGRWIVVTGASSGIGREIAKALVALGARVVLVGRDAEALETARREAGADNARVQIIDLSDTDRIGPAIRDVAERTGKIFGLVHAAGVAPTLPLSATKPARVRAAMDVNYVAGIELARAIADRATITEEGGSLLFIASVYAHLGAPGQIAYCGTKGAIVASARAMALELAPRRIRVNTISPGFVETDMTRESTSRLTREQWDGIAAMHPLGVGGTGDVARAATFLLHPANRWITGTDLVIDGGYSLR
jgi:NAD(P)-dependent dehydrogenase (short-subunit alcohol dehydrogenase family)